MVFETLQIRNAGKEKIKHTLQKIVGIAIPTAILLYVALGIPKAIQVDKKLEPLKKQFEYVAKTHSPTIERIQGFDEKKVLDYGGALDKIVAERDKICRDNDCVYSGRWMSSNNEVSLDGGPFCYWPF